MHVAETLVSAAICTQHSYIVKQITCFNSRVVTMVAWFTLVLEANCIRQLCSFLVIYSSGIRKRGGNNKETTSLVVLYN